MKAQDFRHYHLLPLERAEQIFAMTDDVAERAHKIAGTRLNSISEISEQQPLKGKNEGPVAPEKSK